jgi:type II secretory pathway pseudopilin PulG
MMFTQNGQKGLILIELVMTLILVGIIGGFTIFFLYSGVSGFITSKKTSETALKAQIALDRISAELKHVQALPSAPVTNSAITYQSSDLTGSRRIRHDPGSRSILLSVDGNENPLLDQVATFTLNLTQSDLDSLDGDQEISSINIGFTVIDVGTLFSVRIFPRSLMDGP